MKVKTINKEYEYSGFKSFIADIIKYSKKDDNCWIGSYTFGLGIAEAYNCPSAIPYNAVGDTSFNGTKGYYRNGKFFSFSDKLQIKYQNSALGRE